MGDYTKTGVKIGTCGRAYYATKGQLERYSLKTPNDPEVNFYLDPKNKCHYAFPFPEYDYKGIGEITSFHPGERAEQIIMIKKNDQELTYHSKIVHHIHPKGGQGINLYCDCPYHSPANVSQNFKDDYIRFNLNNHVQNSDGSMSISGECIYCGESNIFTQAEAVEAAANLLKEAGWNDKEALRPEYAKMANKETHIETASRLRLISSRIIDTYSEKLIKA